jgi:hypothetical protein
MTTAIAEQARMLRVHGWKRKYYPEMLAITAAWMKFRQRCCV